VYQQGWQGKEPVSSRATSMTEGRIILPLKDTQRPVAMDFVNVEE
jgi:hypothetical protein